MARQSYVQCPETNKLIPREEYAAYKYGKSTAAVHTFTERVSPIDGTVIRDARQLAAHNARHGVTDSRDYSQAHFDRKAYERKQTLNGKSKQEKANRVNEIKRNIHRAEHGYR